MANCHFSMPAVLQASMSKGRVLIVHICVLVQGEALNPLQRLAREGLGSRDSQSADDEGADGDDAAQDNPNLHIRTVMGASRGTIAVAANANGKLPDGLYVVDERADARFASAAALMKSRDALDKARVKALRMEIKHAAKAKRRERDGGDNEMGAGRPSYGGGGHSEEEDIDQGGVQEEYSGSEGPGLESDEGGEDEGGGRGVGSNGDDSMDSAEEQVGGGRRPGSKQKHGVNGKRQRHTEDSDQGHSDGGEGSSGSGSDEVGGLDTRKEMAGVSGGRAAKRGKSAGGVEVAHTGMAHKSASGSDLSLAEQEALALKMLLGGR